MGKRDLDSYEYDHYLKGRAHKSRDARNEMKDRMESRKSKGYEGWHFGIGDKPVKTRDKDEFRRALNDRGLMMRDEVKRELK